MALERGLYFYNVKMRKNSFISGTTDFKRSNKRDSKASIQSQGYPKKNIYSSTIADDDSRVLQGLYDHNRSILV